MRLLMLLILILLGVNGWASNPFLPLRNEIGTFLNQWPKIRVPITSANGFGHQAAGESVVKQLRNLGFRGHIQVVYEGLGTAEKLEMLFPPYRNKDDKEVFLEGQNLSIAPRSIISSKDSVFLGVMGADDNGYGPDRYFVDALLSLQPFQFDRGRSPRLMLKRAIPLGNSSYNIFSFSDLKDKGFIYPLTQPVNIPQFVSDSFSHVEQLQSKIEGVSAILNQNQFEVLPVYGHKISQNFQLRRLIVGLSHAQRSHSEAFRGGIIVPVINEIEFEDIKPFLDSILLKTNYKGVISVTDPQLKTQLKNLKRGEIIVISVGKVTSPVFELLYSKATLPPVVEGANSINLMQLMGRPYLPSVFHEFYHFIREVKDSDLEALELSIDAAKYFLGEIDDPKALGDFFLESKKPDSVLNKLFANHSKSEATHLNQDHLVIGLQRLIDILGSQSQAKPRCTSILSIF